jgi:hydrogenase maturation protease
MRILLIACGNRLRGEDGVAADAVERIGRMAPYPEIRLLHQLTPEVAAEIAGYSAVVFVDADASAREVRIEKIAPAPEAAALSHHVHPTAIVHLARSLFDFRGDAFLCHIPAMDFRPGCELTARGRRQSRRAVIAIEALLKRLTRVVTTQLEECSTCVR